MHMAYKYITHNVYKPTSVYTHYRIWNCEYVGMYVHKDIIIYADKGKFKAIPLQAWTDPEGSRRLRLPDFKTINTRRW